jgi:hypothetical protein
VRQLYADQDEVLFNATRPIILNGIDDMVSRPDLADRTVFLTLQPIPDDRRRSEQEFWNAFEHHRPQILGALLDGVVRGLKMTPETRLDKPPRMADFALWATACETCFWQAGTFLSAYANNRTSMIHDVLEADPVACAIRMFADASDWEGTAAELLAALNTTLTDAQQRAKGWPQTPRTLGGRIRRAATFLRAVGIEITFERSKRARTLHIRKVTEQDGISSSPPSPAPRSLAQNPPSIEAKDLRSRTTPASGDCRPGETTDLASPARYSVTRNFGNSLTDNAGDNGDAKMPTQTPDGAELEERF